MLTEIIKEIEKITSLGKSRTDKQKLLNSIEVGMIWDVLAARYDTIETTRVLLSFAKDKDLKFILQQGEKFLSREARIMEELTIEFGIASPMRPSANPLSIHDTEVVTDRYIFRQVLNGIQSFLPVLTYAFTRSISARIRDIFASFIAEELKLYSEFMEYGTFKGWVNSPPAFRL
jgi:hypothetical protein